MFAVPKSAGDEAARLCAFGLRQVPEQPTTPINVANPRAVIANRKLRILPTSHTVHA